MRNQAKLIAFGGIFAALAMVIMCLVGLIPIATYVCPMLCAVICSVVLKYTGSRITWAWYFTVAILSLLLAPDKEAAFVFLFLGYYPIIRAYFKKSFWGRGLKLVYFNASVCALYAILIHLLGMNALREEYAEFGLVGLGILLVLGNACFVMLDFLLGRIQKNGKR